MGLIFYFGNIIESFMNISLNVKKVDQDFKWFDNNATSPYDGYLLTQYDLKSVVISYSWLGILSIVGISIIDTLIVCFVTLDFINMPNKKKAVNSQLKHK
jgi:hypothetical protein